jgi:hypothetical protein
MITYTQASGADIEKIVARISTVIKGEPINHVGMACLSIAVMLQDPNITPEKLVQAVKGASEWIACFTDATNSNTPETVN